MADPLPDSDYLFIPACIRPNFPGTAAILA